MVSSTIPHFRLILLTKDLCDHGIMSVRADAIGITGIKTTHVPIQIAGVQPYFGHLRPCVSWCIVERVILRSTSAFELVTAIPAITDVRAGEQNKRIRLEHQGVLNDQLDGAGPLLGTDERGVTTALKNGRGDIGIVALVIPK